MQGAGGKGREELECERRAFWVAQLQNLNQLKCVVLLTEKQNKTVQ